MLPSASIGKTSALFEPIHGSYPQAAGKDIANPIGSILSASMLLYHLEMKEEAQLVRDAVNYLLEGADMEKVRLEQPGVPLASLRAGADYMSDAARGITHPMLAAAFRDAARELRRMAVEAEHVNREVEGVK